MGIRFNFEGLSVERAYSDYWSSVD